MALGRIGRGASQFMERIADATKAFHDHAEQMENMIDEEKNKMNAFTEAQRAGQDVIEINVGGEIMMTKRGVLLAAEGSLLEAMFSGRWEESLDRDASGRVFLDFSPGPFRLLLSHLRVVRDSGPDKKVGRPVIPPKHRAEFDCMVDFLQLREFIFGKFKPIDPVALELVVPGQAGGVTANGGRVTGGTGQHTAVVGRGPLLPDSSEPVYWKLNIIALPPNGFFLAGIIANPTPQEVSYADVTSFGWSGGPFAFRAGSQEQAAGGWGAWELGDQAFFKLDNRFKQLHMRLRRGTTTTAHILELGQAPIERMMIHFNVRAPGTVAEVEACTEEEMADVFGAAQ